MSVKQSAWGPMVVCVCLGFVALSACAMKDTFHMLRGRVVDSATLAPVDSVTILRDGVFYDVTLEDGRFVVGVGAPDNNNQIEIRFQKSGYEVYMCVFPQDVEADPGAAKSYRKDVLLVRHGIRKQNDMMQTQSLLSKHRFRNPILDRRETQ